MIINGEPFIHPGPFGKMIHDKVMALGGWINPHAHFDRGFTIFSNYLTDFGVTPLQVASLPLSVKQNIVGELHKDKLAYTEEDLERRMRLQLDLMIEDGVKEATSFIDATPDIGLRAVEVARGLKYEYKEKVDFDFKVAVQPIFGFKDDPHYPESRWEVFKTACAKADIIGGLPEKDDRPDSVGFRWHTCNIIHLGHVWEKEVHIHADQDNVSKQHHTHDILKAVYGLGTPSIKGHSGPTLWIIHMTSTSCYDEVEFREIIDQLKEYNIGVICCPSAALSTRQNRAEKTPTHNSIVRILELAHSGIPVRIGTDNIADIFVPASPGSLLFEMLLIAITLRFPYPDILAKLGAGVELNQSDREKIRRHLEQDVEYYKTTDPNFEFAIPLDK